MAPLTLTKLIGHLKRIRKVSNIYRDTQTLLDNYSGAKKVNSGQGSNKQYQVGEDDCKLKMKSFKGHSRSLSRFLSNRPCGIIINCDLSVKDTNTIQSSQKTFLATSPVGPVTGQAHWSKTTVSLLVQSDLWLVTSTSVCKISPLV